MFFRSLSALLALAIITAGLSVPTRASSTPGSNSAAGEDAISQLDYSLQAYDLIHVVVFQEPDLERQVRLSDDFQASLPLIGMVSFKGKTVGQAQQLIRDLYNKDYLVNPQITVTVLEYAKEMVNVLGQVNTPGAIPIPPDQPLNLLDAIARAGGFNRLADKTKVKLTRVNSSGPTSTQINVDDLIKGRSADQVVLRKGDVIFVPERIL